MRSLRLFLFSPLPVAADESDTLADLPGCLASCAARAPRPSRTGIWSRCCSIRSAYSGNATGPWHRSAGSGTVGRPARATGSAPIPYTCERSATRSCWSTRATLRSSEVRDALIDALNAHFAADGLRFFRAPPDSLVRCRRLRYPRSRLRPCAPQPGATLTRCCRRGRRPPWHRWFNEIQMLFHSHTVNEARELPVSRQSTACGSGAAACYPMMVPGLFAGMWSDDPLARGSRSLPEQPVLRCRAPNSGWPRPSRGRTRPGAIVLSRRPNSPLEELERKWFTPMLSALRGRELSMLSLLIGAATTLCASM